jgi:hypothetical protein
MLYPYPANTVFTKSTLEFDIRPSLEPNCCNVRHRKDWYLNFEADFTSNPNPTPCVARALYDLPEGLHYINISAGSASIQPPMPKFFNKVFKAIISFGFYTEYPGNYKKVMLDLTGRSCLEPHELFVEVAEFTCVPMITGRKIGIEMMYRGTWDAANNPATAQISLSGEWDILAH